VASCGGPSADELNASRPARHELVVRAIVPANGRHVVDVDPEEVKPTRLGCPSEPCLLPPLCIDQHGRVVLEDGPRILHSPQKSEPRGAEAWSRASQIMQRG
jgi:hypothetical protein